MMVEVGECKSTWFQSLNRGLSVTPFGHGGARVPSRSIVRRHKVTRRVKSDRGVAALEFALVFPLFMMILFAIIQFGFVFFVWNDMGNAAREATRRLSVDDTITEAQAANVAKTWLATWPGTFTVKACRIAATTSDPAGCTGIDTVTVTVTAPVNEVSLVGPIAFDFGFPDLRVFVAMRKEGIP